MSEFAPPGKNAKMTKAQVKKYLKDMKKAQALAKQKLQKAQASGELDKEKKEIEILEDLLK